MQGKTQKALFILFGIPGAGKNIAAEYLRKRYGFFHYDADIDFTHAQKQNHIKGVPSTVEQRDEYFSIVKGKIQILYKQNSALVVTSWLPTKYQTIFKKEFPQATFILVEAPRQIVIERLLQRKNHYITSDHAIRAIDRWGTCVIEHKTIVNDKNISALEKQIDILMKH